MKTSALCPLLSLLVVVCAGCATTEPAPAPDAAADAAAIPDQSGIPPERRLRVGPTAPPPEPAVVGVSFGRGIAAGDNMKVTFMHNVTRFEDGSAKGVFTQSAMTESGALDIEVDVSCVELDSEAGKAWIGGTVKRNDSTSPLHAGPTGREAWFRVLDRGAEQQTAWITLVSFGEGRIATAAAHCDKRPWSEKGLLQLEQGALAIFP